jgi:adenosylhomocysteinase
MDMSFAIQALSAAYLAQRTDRLEPDLYPVPEEIDNDIAMRKLSAMGISIDFLTSDQRRYLDGWLT